MPNPQEAVIVKSIEAIDNEIAFLEGHLDFEGAQSPQNYVQSSLATIDDCKVKSFLKKQCGARKAVIDHKAEYLLQNAVFIIDNHKESSKDFFVDSTQNSISHYAEVPEMDVLKSPFGKFDNCAFNANRPDFIFTSFRPYLHKSLSFDLHAWTTHDRKVFMHQYITHPKRFHKIASHIALKNTRQCVLYYYLRKHAIHLKQKAASKGIYVPPSAMFSFQT